jgi:CO/xanthine dehydrogenase FAD-binding subunit
MKPFDLREPDSLQEAVGLLDPDDPSTRAIAGGTALMLMMKAGVFQPRRLVSLRRIARQYSGIVAVEDARGSADYKRALVRISVARGVRRCMGSEAPPQTGPFKTSGGHV